METVADQKPNRTFRYFKIITQQQKDTDDQSGGSGDTGDTSIDPIQSRFKSCSQPKSAATKALRKIIDMSLIGKDGNKLKNPVQGNFPYYNVSKDGKNFVYTFTIQETTRGKTNKQPLTYSGYRTLLADPASYEIKTKDGQKKTITNFYKSYLRKVPASKKSTNSTTTIKEAASRVTAPAEVKADNKKTKKPRKQNVNP
jgi:hypothetical protein